MSGTVGYRAVLFYVCGRRYGCIGVCGGCEGFSHRKCLIMVGRGGNTSRALGTRGFWGHLVCPVPSVFNSVCSIEMGVPEVNTLWGLGSKFVVLCGESEASVGSGVGVGGISCDVGVMRCHAVRCPSRCVWGAGAFCRELPKCIMVGGR